mgnify:CR=1 FL=1
MKDIELFITVGLPRSGKSTVIRESYANRMPVVSPDAIRLAMHGQRFAIQAEPLVWATAKIMLNALIGAGNTQICIDATNTTRWQRDSWLPEAKRHFLVFETPARICKERAVATGQDDLIPIIEKMNMEFENVVSDEGTKTVIPYVGE